MDPDFTIKNGLVIVLLDKFILPFSYFCRTELIEIRMRRLTTTCVTTRTRVTAIQADHFRHSTQERVTLIW